jgi:hypothetical protein
VRNDLEPPASRIPSIRDGTLVTPDALKWPNIPAVTYSGLHNGSGERDFGPRVQGNAGVIDKLFPDILSVHRILVPQVDAVGSDIAGIRHPNVAVPVATLTGWNTRAAEFGGDDLCDLLGSMIPLPATAEQARTSHDPRPALSELYRNHDDYVAQVKQAVAALQRDRLLLPEDAELIVREAQDSDVLR